MDVNDTATYHLIGIYRLPNLKQNKKQQLFYFSTSWEGIQKDWALGDKFL